MKQVPKLDWDCAQPQRQAFKDLYTALVESRKALGAQGFGVSWNDAEGTLSFSWTAKDKALQALPEKGHCEATFRLESFSVPSFLVECRFCGTVVAREDLQPTLVRTLIGKGKDAIEAGSSEEMLCVDCRCPK